MKGISSLVISLNIIGLTAAYVCPPLDGCIWGLSPKDLSIQPGSVITDAVITLTNIRPSMNCLNPVLSIRLLENTPAGFTLLNDSSQVLVDCFQEAPSLSGAWPMNEYTGTEARDFSGNSNPALFINAPTWVKEEGISFADNQYLQIEDTSNLCSRSPIAVSVWFKIRSPRRYAKLFIKPFETRSAPWELLAVDLGADGLTPRFLLSDGIPDGQYAAAFDNGFKTALNQWYHILGTYDGTRMRLFVNGQPIAETQINLAIGTNTMPICIGGRLGLDTIDGFIRDVRVYSGPPASESLQWLPFSDVFEPHGTPLKSITFQDIQATGQNLSFSLQQLDVPQSWVRTIYPTPFSLTVPERQTPLQFSSSLLELLDYVGRGSTWGLGVDTDGFCFDTITLTLTIEPIDGSQPAQLQSFAYRNIYPPLILPRTSITAELGQNVSFSLFTLERDGNPCTVSAPNLPTGASFTNNFFSWTPTLDQIGLWTILFEASDGVMSSQRVVFISIKEPTPIFTPVENQIIYERQPLDLTIQAVNLAGHPVPITASGLPLNASFDGNIFEWEPLYGQAGTYVISFTASNEIRQETIDLTITVLPYKLPAKNKTILIL